jgi:hypothetical protein
MSIEQDRFKIPPNSISVFVGRVCEDVSDSFAQDGILWVDLSDLTGDGNLPNHDESVTSQHKAIASWTLRSAYIAWTLPPKIKFKGNAKLKGRITMSNAQLTNVNISGGPPLQGTVTCPLGPGTSTTPVAISSASGSAKIEQTTDAEIEMTTDENLDIELTSQKGAQLPWCVDSDNPEESAEVDEEQVFIRAGDLALCMAFGNSLRNLYVVDILR